MNKFNFKNLALLGITGSLTIAAGGFAEDTSSKKPSESTRASKTLTEAQLLSQLNKEGRSLYQSLSPDGKLLAQRLAGGSCNGRNECRGKNSCATASNGCRGKGGCGGKGSALFKDKNHAVQVASDFIENERKRVSTEMLHNGMNRINKAEG